MNATLQKKITPRTDSAYSCVVIHDETAQVDAGQPKKTDQSTLKNMKK